jgi:predicted AAA+ superfamily ATPase
MMKNLSERLAECVGIFELLGLSLRKINGDDFNLPFMPTDVYIDKRKPHQTSYNDVWTLNHKGSYPKLYDRPKLNWDIFYNNYVNTYLERDVKQIETGAMSGAFFKTFVFCEILKSYYNAGIDPHSHLYFYRDTDDNEIDFIINYDGQLHPIEVKKRSNPDLSDIRAVHFVSNNETIRAAMVRLFAQTMPLSQ